MTKDEYLDCMEREYQTTVAKRERGLIKTSLLDVMYFLSTYIRKLVSTIFVNIDWLSYLGFE